MRARTLAPPYFSAPRLLLAGCLALAATLLALPAAAECLPPSLVSTCVDSDNFWPHAGPSRFIAIGTAETTAKGQLSFALMTSYQKRPLVLRYPRAGGGSSELAAIDHQANATFLTAWAPARGIQIHLATPATLYQTGVGASASQSQTTRPIVRSVIRDTRLGATVVVLPFSPRGTGLGLAYRTDFVLASGDESVFAGGRTPGVAPSMTGEYRASAFTVAAELGLRLRPVTPIGGTRVGSQQLFALGVGYEILPRELLSAQVEASSLVSLVEQRDVSRDPSTRVIRSTAAQRTLAPSEWLASVRSSPALAGDISFHAGVGTALPLSSDNATAPSFRIVGGMRYAPLGRDADGDGVLDRDDRCPQEPEDLDGFEDADGCPDLDNDRDGVPDAKDRCRDKAEDKDGFEDDDGCPDPDDDGDGILDVDDRCRNEPEDKDGFEDEDGCPDLDNDGDGIPDAKDACPNNAEDLDGFRDEDGCPDPDNDADGIPDDQDQCPLQAEDKDGFEDDDGCPDLDNDKDGIPDADDKCKLDPETINGIDDEDGCPEPNAKDLVTLAGSRVVLATPARFPAGSAKAGPDLERAVRMIAQKIKSFGFIERAIIEVHADRPGATARHEKLANARADAVRAILASTGLPLDLVTVAAGDPNEKRAPGAAHIEAQIITKRTAK